MVFMVKGGGALDFLCFLLCLRMSLLGTWNWGSLARHGYSFAGRNPLSHVMHTFNKPSSHPPAPDLEVRLCGQSGCLHVGRLEEACWAQARATIPTSMVS